MPKTLIQAYKDIQLWGGISVSTHTRQLSKETTLN